MSLLNLEHLVAPVLGGDRQVVHAGENDPEVIRTVAERLLEASQKAAADLFRLAGTDEGQLERRLFAGGPFPGRPEFRSRILGEISRFLETRDAGLAFANLSSCVECLLFETYRTTFLEALEEAGAPAAHHRQRKAKRLFLSELLQTPGKMRAAHRLPPSSSVSV